MFSNGGGDNSKLTAVVNATTHISSGFRYWYGIRQSPMCCIHSYGGLANGLGLIQSNGTHNRLVGSGAFLVAFSCKLGTYSIVQADLWEIWWRQNGC